MSKKAIGIDLGSTMSSIAFIDESGKPVVIANEEGGYGTPSIINLKEDIKVGGVAKRQMVMYPKETINIIKRFMGLTYVEAKEAINHVQYEVVDKSGKAAVKVNDKIYTPEELSAMILQKMKKIAEDYLGEEIKDVVVTVPAYFSDNSRTATANAAKIAGLNPLRIIAEPTSALLASKIDMSKGGKFMVTDFGGATLDNSIADISDNVVEILATNGDLFLGGSNIDKAVSDFLIEQFKNDNGIDLSKDSQAVARVIEAAEKAKIELSQSTKTDINLPYITMKDGAPVHMMVSLTRAQFDKIITPFVNRLIECSKKALADADLKGEELDGILLVGGSCRIPLVQDELKKINPNLIHSANLDLAVAEGAAIQCSMINGDSKSDLVLLDVCPLNYGIETLGDTMTTLIEANTTIPCKRTETFSTAQDNQTAVTIKVLNGNRPLASMNKEVGIFNLDGILPAKRGIPQVDVTFDIDANGILTVTACDKGTKKEQHITIQSKGGLTDEEIERMKREAEENAEADKKLREKADTLNKADSIIFNNEKMMEDMNDKLSDEDKADITSLVEEMKQAKSDENLEKINELEKSINDKWNSISQKIYSQGQTEQPKSEETTSNNADGNNTTDANFEEVK